MEGATETQDDKKILRTNTSRRELSVCSTNDGVFSINRAI